MPSNLSLYRLHRNLSFQFPVRSLWWTQVGFEPTASCLPDKHSTTELLAHLKTNRIPYKCSTTYLAISLIRSHLQLIGNIVTVPECALLREGSRPLWFEFCGRIGVSSIPTKYHSLEPCRARGWHFMAPIYRGRDFPFCPLIVYGLFLQPPGMSGVPL